LKKKLAGHISVSIRLVIFDQGPVAARLLCRCSGAEASVQIAFAAMGKNIHLFMVYTTQKRLVTSGIVYSCFNNSECGKSLIMVDVFWDSQVISSTTASIKGLPLYGASSHQLESEASLDLPATRQQTLTPQKA
jgi:hypothetical protein